jgi:hypothetical protein
LPNDQLLASERRAGATKRGGLVPIDYPNTSFLPSLSPPNCIDRSSKHQNATKEETVTRYQESRVSYELFSIILQKKLTFTGMNGTLLDVCLLLRGRCIYTDRSTEWDETSTVAGSTIGGDDEDGQEATADLLEPLIDFEDELPIRPTPTPNVAATWPTATPVVSTNTPQPLGNAGGRAGGNPLQSRNVISPQRAPITSPLNPRQTLTTNIASPQRSIPSAQAQRNRSVSNGRPQPFSDVQQRRTRPERPPAGKSFAEGAKLVTTGQTRRRCGYCSAGMFHNPSLPFWK